MLNNQFVVIDPKALKFKYFEGTSLVHEIKSDQMLTPEHIEDFRKNARSMVQDMDWDGEDPDNDLVA